MAVRSLEQSGEVSFICTSSDPEQPGVSIEACAAYTAPPQTDSFNRLLALVTQTTRGEVALVDLSAGSVVDLDPSKPGFNFVPVGGNPVDIVSTPGGTVSFVASAEATRESIWVLPTRTILKPGVHLTSFAACSLPSAPGQMQLLIEPFGADGAYQSCDGVALDGDHPNGDMSRETVPAGIRKLLVSLPDLGDVALLDVQQLLDLPAGSFDPCPVERVVHLNVDRPAILPQQATPEGGWPPGQDENGEACVLTERADVPATGEFFPRPSGFAYDADGAVLYVADEAAPVVHVLDVSSPCNMTERPSLLPMSRWDPGRDVFTRRLAVSPPTRDGRKFLYATDLREGSVMMFDVGPGSTDRTPLLRPYPARNPYQPPDRISFSVPIRTMEFALLDVPVSNSAGAAPTGVLCDPANDSALGAAYRTGPEFSSGADPRKLRGVFGLLALTNGQIVITDLEDFDAQCRRPIADGPGVCPNELFDNYHGASGEASCNVVEPHQPRSATYLVGSDAAGTRLPTMQSYPTLSLENSTLPFADLQNPRLVPPDDGLVIVGGRVVEDPRPLDNNAVALDLTEPRVHVDQDWSIIFEGGLPGFGGHVGRLDAPAQSGGLGVFNEPSAFFCSRGVHDLTAALAVAHELGLQGSLEDPNSEAYRFAVAHADTLQITERLLDEEDPYWDAVAGQCSYASCSQRFGFAEDPRSPREFRIVEAYQNRLLIDGQFDDVGCCFPMLPTYNVRGSNQWIVTGSASGFLHKVVTDPQTGRCIDTCDPTRQLLNGRAYQGVPFRNTLMRFTVLQGVNAAGEPVASQRDMIFSFRQGGGFVPLMINLAASTSFVQPLSMTVLPQTGQLAITDGSTQGLIMINLGSQTVAQTFF